jgi:hypothetical protein
VIRIRPDGLATGPQDPVTATPPRRPGSVRRTTSIDQRRGDPGRPQHLVAVGRDLRTRDDGSAEVIDQARVEATIDGSAMITAIASDPPEPALQGLVGDSVSKGLRRRLDALVPEHRAAASVLHQLIDDFPMASLISSYGSSREQVDFTLPPGTAAGLTDLCSGWQGGGTMLGALEATGIFPIPLGPDAPDLASADDPLAWHELPELARRSIRRRRRLDVVLVDGTAQVDVHFRDSHLGAGDAPEDVLHEYTLAVEVDPDELVVLASTATARVLPWPECPGSLASAERAVGELVARLRPLVSTKFTGTSTCTHLNDTLRSVAGVAPLIAALRPGA